MSYSLRIEQTGLLIHRKGLSKSRSLRISYQLEIEETQLVNHVQNIEELQFNGILGIKVVRNIPFVIIIKQHENICGFHGGQVYEIKSIGWVPLTKDTHKLDEDTGLEQELNSISKIFQQGLHFYSDNYKLFQPFLLNAKKRQQNTSFKSQQQSQPQQSYYQQFIWNNNIIKIDANSEYVTEMFNEKNKSAQNVNNKRKSYSYQQSQKVFEKWCTPIIQGYVNMFQVILPDKVKLQYVLISRMSYKKAGTRFFSRGIDDCGNVANYTQTEHIIHYNDTVMSHIQLRGSVPVFFQQIGVEGINIELNIQRSKQLTKKPFILHFNTILSHYNRTLCINLLSQKKKSQLKLSKFYEQMIDTTTPYLSEVRYQYFDFHQECKNNEFQNTQRLIEKIRQSIQNFGFNCFNMQSRKLIKRQTGVIRTNCLDCLDRTNYVQSRVALQVLKAMLVSFTSETTKKNVRQFQLLQQTELQFNSYLLNQFNSLWAENGDSVSLHYTGIGSTHTDITKIGKRTLFGTVNHKMRSLMRFYTQFTDVKKHETINTFLGNKSVVKFSINTEKQKKTKQENIMVLSWQFTDPENSLYEFDKNPYNSKTYQHLITQLRQQLGNRYMLIVIFLYIPNQLINWQSGINFDIKNILNPFKNSYSELISKWSDFIITELESTKQRYTLIDSNEHSSCRMLIFCKKNQLQAISNIKKDQITSSLKTKQVALLTKFKLYDSPLVFQAFNVKNINNFADFLQKTHEKGFQQNILGRSKSTSISQQSYRLILGNVGSETTLTEDQFTRLQNAFEKIRNNKSTRPQELQSKQENSVIALISKGCEYDELKQLLESSQLLNEKKIKVLGNYNEAPLEFIPSNNRILFWNQEGKIVRAKSYQKIVQSQYGAISFKKSKSKPINEDGISVCYPTFKQQKQRQTESCVCFQLSYQIDDISS